MDFKLTYQGQQQTKIKQKFSYKKNETKFTSKILKRSSSCNTNLQKTVVISTKLINTLLSGCLPETVCCIDIKLLSLNKQYSQPIIRT